MKLRWNADNQQMASNAERFVEVPWTADMPFVPVPVTNARSCQRTGQGVTPLATKFAPKLSTLVRILVIGAVIPVKIVEYVNNAANFSAFILDVLEFAEPIAYLAPNHVPGPANMLARAT